MCVTIILKKYVFFPFLWVIHRFLWFYSYLWCFAIKKKTNEYVVEVVLSQFIYYCRKKKENANSQKSKSYPSTHLRFTQAIWQKHLLQITATKCRREHMRLWCVCNICMTVRKRRKNGIKKETRRAHIKRKTNKILKKENYSMM